MYSYSNSYNNRLGFTGLRMLTLILVRAEGIGALKTEQSLPFLHMKRKQWAEELKAIDGTTTTETTPRVVSPSCWKKLQRHSRSLCQIQQGGLHCCLHCWRFGRAPSTHGPFDIHFSSNIYFEVINPHIVGSLTIPRASIKWV